MGGLASVNPSCTFDSSDDLEKDVSSLKGRLDAIKEEVAELKSTMHTILHDLSEEDKGIDKLSTKIDHLAFTMEFRIAAMKEDLDNIKRKKIKPVDSD